MTYTLQKYFKKIRVFNPLVDKWRDGRHTFHDLKKADVTPPNKTFLFFI